MKLYFLSNGSDKTLVIAKWILARLTGWGCFYWGAVESKTGTFIGYDLWDKYVLFIIRIINNTQTFKIFKPGIIGGRQAKSKRYKPEELCEVLQFTFIELPKNKRKIIPKNLILFKINRKKFTFSFFYVILNHFCLFV